MSTNGTKSAAQIADEAMDEAARLIETATRLIVLASVLMTKTTVLVDTEN